MNEPSTTQARGGDAVAPGPAASAGGSALSWLWLSAFVVAADHATKWLIVTRLQLFERHAWLPFLEITRLHNRGAAFSFLNDASGWQRWFFMALAFGVSAGIVVWLARLRMRGSSLLGSALALIAGGALGNGIDRVLHGHVIDFIHFHWYEAWSFPAFNLADTAITIGAALLLLDAFRDSRRGGAWRT